MLIHKIVGLGSALLTRQFSGQKSASLLSLQDHSHSNTTTSLTPCEMLSTRQLTKLFEPICVYSGALLTDLTYSREHIFPVSRLKTQAARSDPHNVYPCDIAINLKRSSYRFTDGPDMLISHKQKIFVPPQTPSRGIIARTCLRMQAVHGVDLHKVIDEVTLRAWLEQYPDVTAYEKRHWAVIEVYGQKVQQQ